MNLEYVYMDALKNENIVEIQPKINSNRDLKSNIWLIVIELSLILTHFYKM